MLVLIVARVAEVVAEATVVGVEAHVAEVILFALTSY
jgi:hypothetical protein